MVSYKFYPSILDKFGDYLNSSQIYQQFWGFSENPELSEQEFEQKQFRSLIDSINRVPIPWEETESMDRGTAFNEVIDCLIENRKSDKIKVEKVFENIHVSDVEPNSGEVMQTKKVTALKVEYNNRVFQFPIDLCREISEYLKGALVQYFCNGEIETKYGKVLLYGYIDHLLAFKCIDLKTTSQYNAFKFRKNLQKIIYPYCLKQMGNEITEFEFVVTDFKKVWTEIYNYNEEIDIPELVEHCEKFIEFLEIHKSIITNQKIFALDGSNR